VTAVLLGRQQRQWGVLDVGMCCVHMVYTPCD